MLPKCVDPGRVRAYVVSASSFPSNPDFVRSLLLSLHFDIMAGADDQVFDAAIAQQEARTSCQSSKG